MDSDNLTCTYCNKLTNIHSCTSCAHSPIDFIHVLNSLYKIKPSAIDKFIKSQPWLIITDAIILYNKDYKTYDVENIPMEFPKMKKFIMNELIE
jgi:hypothetical protein